MNQSYFIPIASAMFAWILAAPSVAVGQDAATGPTREQLKTLSDAAATLHDVAVETRREHLSRARPGNPREAARVAGRGLDAIQRWVWDNVRYEPYAGALRSPEQVLEQGAANSVDLARLVHAMVLEQGLSAEFAWGQLPEKDAVKLLTSFAGAATMSRGGEDVPGAGEFSTRAVHAARQHVWVEVSGADGLTTLDPLGGVAVGTTSAKLEGRGASLPASFSSTFALTMVARLEDGQRHEVLAASGSLDDFSRDVLTIGFAPDLRLEHATRPTLKVGSKVKAGDYFPRDALVSLTLRFEVVVGERQRQWERALYRRSDRTRAFELEQQHVGVAVLTGWTTDQQLARVGGRSLVDAMALARAWSKASEPGAVVDAPSFERQTRELLDETARVFPYAFARHLDRVTLGLARSLGVRAVMVEPRVIVTSTVRHGDAIFVDADIQGDSLEAIAALGMPRAARGAFEVAQARLEYELEERVLGQLLDAPAFSTARLFAKARAAKTTVKTLHPGNSRMIDKLFGANKQLAKFLGRQVASTGQVLLVPRRAVEVDGVERFAWWAVDPVTGAVHGARWQGLFDITQGLSGVSSSQGKAMIALTRQAGRLLSVWVDALDDSRGLEGHTCAAVKDVRGLSRAMCATRKAKPLPALESCLSSQDPTAEGAAAADDPLAMSAPGCDELVAPMRCGAVVAHALLTGELAVTWADDRSAPVAPRCK